MSQALVLLLAMPEADGADAADAADRGPGTGPRDVRRRCTRPPRHPEASAALPDAALPQEPAERAKAPPEDATGVATQDPGEVPGTRPAGDPDRARLERARHLLQEAIRRSQAKGPPPSPGGLRPFPGMRVDKYFGTKLPPVCASLGCYVTDDGKRFYCVNPACQKHKKRETKHTRKGNPAKAHFVYFRCPRCESRSLEMHLLSNRYVCRACKYSWTR